MFTGIIEAIGELEAVTPRGEHVDLELACAKLAAEVGLGDSVALNGTCLTVTSMGGGRIHFDAIAETLARTNLGELAPGSPVNMERAMRADGRFDGHIVQGHVDETGRVRAWERRGSDVRLEVETSRSFAALLVEKGSVTLDGVSLTVSGLGEEHFAVALIPYTLEVTTLGTLEVGQRVNLEADLLGKYVKQYLDRVAPGVGADG